MADRVLLLAFAFPPAAAPEAFLSAKRMGALPHHVADVVSAAPPPSWREARDDSLEAYVAGRFGSIVRVSAPRAFQGMPRAARLFEPDTYRVFARGAVHAALRLAAANDYAAVVTWSQWHSVHLAGLEIQRRIGLPWLAHLSDPWVENPFENLRGIRRRRNLALERRVFEAADMLLFTSGHAIDLSMAKYPLAWRAKVRAVPHAYDPSLYDDADPPTGSTVVLRCLGAFYGRRTPNPLLHALGVLARRDAALAERLRVEIVGFVQNGVVDRAALESLPPGMLTIVPPVDYLESLSLMASAHGLLLVDAPAESSPFLPSKLIDYVGAGRPIASLTPPGPAADVTRAVGGFVADPLDEESCAAAISEVAGAAGSSGTFGDAGARARFDVVRVGAAMDEIVQEAAAARAS